jgi:uncharacterized membrane protein YdjX (TVP38/TMEM64 family)
VASGRGIQTSSLVLGVLAGFVLYWVFQRVFYILIGVAIGAALVFYLSRRR